MSNQLEPREEIETFLDTPIEENELDSANIVVLQAPYDGTTSYKPGTRNGPKAIIQASKHLEDYDIELNRDVSLVGIHTAPPINFTNESPQDVICSVENSVATFANSGKLITLLGGEHTITVGAIRALVKIYPELSVLYLDAHSDFRNEYMGTRWGHASVARRISEICPLVQAGVRSMSEQEKIFIDENNIPVHCLTPHTPSPTDLSKIHLRDLTQTVYISIDLDVFDPAVVSAVGNPEPGGFLWNDVITILRSVIYDRHIVGFDITELSPSEGPEAGALTAAKLAYKMMGYSTTQRRSNE